MSGEGEVADYLRSRGAVDAGLDPVDELVAAALAGDRAAVRRLGPSIVEDARRARPGLMVWAAARGRPDGVALLAELGFDVNAYGRRDAPVEEPWETALHAAALDGHDDLVRLLLGLGADRSLRDVRFGATPADWARHQGHPGTAALIEA
ncbi:ankyrin repeat domain-containing protein [Luedemannella flava]